MLSRYYTNERILGLADLICFWDVLLSDVQLGLDGSFHNYTNPHEPIANAHSEVIRSSTACGKNCMRRKRHNIGSKT